MIEEVVESEAHERGSVLEGGGKAAGDLGAKRVISFFVFRGGTAYNNNPCTRSTALGNTQSGL